MKEQIINTVAGEAVKEGAADLIKSTSKLKYVGYGGVVVAAGAGLFLLGKKIVSKKKAKKLSEKEEKENIINLDAVEHEEDE